MEQVAKGTWTPRAADLGVPSPRDSERVSHVKATYSNPLPAHQLCPLCGRDDPITIEPIADGIWRYTCSNTVKHSVYTWSGTATSAMDDPTTDNKAEGLGLYSDLPHCLVPGEPFVEYGVVEYRFSLLRPDVYAELIDDYGHTRQGPMKYTASAFIAKAMGTLADRGEVLYKPGRATGYWAYNSGISYWALPPGPENPNEVLTYREFAMREGLDPEA